MHKTFILLVQSLEVYVPYSTTLDKKFNQQFHPYLSFINDWSSRVDIDSCLCVEEP